MMYIVGILKLRHIFKPVAESFIQIRMWRKSQKNAL